MTHAWKIGVLSLALAAAAVGCRRENAQQEREHRAKGPAYGSAGDLAEPHEAPDRRDVNGNSSRITGNETKEQSGREAPAASGRYLVEKVDTKTKQVFLAPIREKENQVGHGDVGADAQSGNGVRAGDLILSFDEIRNVGGDPTALHASQIVSLDRNDEGGLRRISVEGR